MKYTRQLLFIALMVLIQLTGQAIEIRSTTVEMMQNPVGLITPTPRFGWIIGSGRQGDRQTAWQIIVSSSPQGLKEETGDIWNSGKVKSDQSQLIPYGGPELQNAKRYFYRVRIWDAKGKRSGWSETAWWEMAPAAEDLQASWIGAIRREDSHLPEGRRFHAPSLKKYRELYKNIPDLAKRSIMLRKELNVGKEISKATVYVSGLGHYELSLNGQKVGQSEFAPLWSDYDKTVYYNTYELTDLLRSGENALGVLLGNGFYNAVGDRYRKLWVSFGPPTLFFQLNIRYTDGTEETIVSDQSWKYAESPITFNDIYGGEDYDARLEQEGWNEPNFDDSSWKPVVIQDAPKGLLTPQLAPAVKVRKVYDIKEWHRPDTATYVFNMGQNLSGYPTIRVQGKRGQAVRIYVGESLREDSTVSQKRTGGPHYYEYTLKGEGIEEWHPRFTYYGYQYVEVRGVDFKGDRDTGDRPLLLDVKSNFIYSAVEEVGDFECSNDLFTRTHVLINNAVKSNMQAVFTDCPHREKLGWLEEIHLNGPGLLYNYDLTQLFAKEMADMRDAQRPEGLVPSIAPEYVVFGGDFTDSPEWGIASVIVPWMYYEFYGDKSLIVNYYDVMKKYLGYLGSTAENHILSQGLGDWYDYGEHAAGYSKNSPIPLSATAHYFYGAKLVAKAAELQGLTEEARKYAALAEEIRKAYNREFFNPETKQYGTGSQYCNAVSVFMGIVAPEHKQAVLDNLVADIRQHGNRLTTGDVGNRYLYQTLARNDLNEVMYTMHNHYDTPGYGFQLQFGLTTLTEQWDPRNGNSWNHFMMGQIEEWFFRSLAGIVPDKENPGFKHFYIQPRPVGDLTYVKASTKSRYGRISVDWTKEDGVFTLSVHVPVNTSATVILPGRIPGRQDEKMTLNNKPAAKAKGVKISTSDDGNMQCTVGSGDYTFEYHY